MWNPLLSSLALIALLLTGCGDGRRRAERTTNFIEQDVEVFQPLGALGVLGHPAQHDVWVPDPDEPGRERHPGGFVVREVLDSSPFLDHCRPGDVIYRVGPDWVPNVADPTVGLVALIEKQCAAGETGVTELELHFLRAGKPRSARLTLELSSLDEGLPGASARFLQLQDRALVWLAAHQLEDGSFPTAERTPDASLAVTSLSGLAFLAHGSGLGGGPHGEPVRRCFEFVKATLAGAEPGGVTGLSYALIFLSELSAGGFKPEIFSELAACVGPLLALQQEHGGWPAVAASSEVGYSDATFGTNLALLALGVAERAGLTAEAELVQRACAFLKQQTNDGQVVYVSEPGFDRRSESGRSAGAAAALRVLNCEPGDPFFRALIEYHRPLTRAVISAPGGALFHLLNAALLARQGGDGGWISFHHEFKHLFVALATGDGSFAPLPGSGRRPFPIEQALEGPAFRTAVFALILGLPGERLGLLLARTEHPRQPRRDGAGKALEAPEPGSGRPPGGLPAGAQMMKFGSMEEARKFMESMGLDPDKLSTGGVMTVEKQVQKKPDKRDG